MNEEIINQLREKILTFQVNNIDLLNQLVELYNKQYQELAATCCMYFWISFAIFAIIMTANVLTDFAHEWIKTICIILGFVVFFLGIGWACNTNMVVTYTSIVQKLCN